MQERPEGIDSEREDRMSCAQIGVLDMMKDKLGKVIIAPCVLLTIVRLTTLSIPGVVRMSGNLAEGMNRFLGKAHIAEGIRLEVHDDMVSADVHVIVKSEVNMLKLGRVIQSEIWWVWA